MRASEVDVDDSACPFCGCERDDQYLDVLRASDGDDIIDWLPCCEDARDLVGSEGWEALADEALVDSLNAATGIGADRVHVEFGDSLALYNLQERVPGTGAKGWQSEVFAAVDAHHEHHDAPHGWKFGVGVYCGRKLVGVAVVGRPASRVIQAAEPQTLEVTRVCCFGHPEQRRNAATKLYALCADEARKLGCTKLITYTLDSESGDSVAMSGFHRVARTKGGSWNTPSRPRADVAPTDRKVRWERGLTRTARKGVTKRAAAFAAGVR